MNEAKKEVIKTINTFATPSGVARSLIQTVCFGEPTIGAVRSLLVNPVTNKWIPEFLITGAHDCFLVSYLLAKDYNKEKVAREIWGTTREKDINDIFERFEKDPETTASYMWYGCNEDKNDSFFLHKGETILYITVRVDTDNWHMSLRVRFIALNPKKSKEEFEEKVDKFFESFQTEKTNRVKIMSMDRRGRMRSSYSTTPNTVILDHIQKEINEVVAMVENAETVSEKYDLNKTVGLLLYGPPGTGKSTIARWLAMKLKRTLILTTGENLIQAIEEVQSSTRNKEKYVLLIEDIDFMFTDRRKTAKKKKGKEEDDEEEAEEIINDREMNQLTSLFFQILDGVLSNKNLMVIATTNYFERLDPALIRDGRFDFKIEVNGLDYETAAKVCERFEITPDEIDLKSWKEPISPATLQAVALKYKVNKGIRNVELLNGEEAAVIKKNG